MITVVCLDILDPEERCDGLLQALQEYVDDNRTQ